MNDTIAAISSALGVGAISIIRISGPKAIDIASRIFKGKDLKRVKSHTIHYGHVYKGKKIIDEVMLSIMKAPKTFTKENIVEINCHGGIATTNQILEAVLSEGARLAEPGEFTKRAFLNGRIDLAQAESVMDLINAKTNLSKNIAIHNLDGDLSKLIKRLREDIVLILSNIEVNIDYPEYEDEKQITSELLKPKIKTYKKELGKLLKNSKTGKLIKEGIKTVIVGKPNVGKSSLLNKLIKEEKAIVTEIPGTTRDIVEGSINVNGIVLNIIDTAGIRDAKNKIEKLGVSITKKLIPEAELILYVLNNNEKIEKKDIKFLEEHTTSNLIIIINKVDLKSKINKELLKDNIIVETSAINDRGIEELKNQIIKMFNLEKIATKDLTYLSNARQVSILEKTLKIIKEIELAIKKGTPIDLIEIDLKIIWNLLGEIIGATYTEELIDEMFSKFCLGK